MPPMRIPQQTIVAAIPKANSSRQNSHKDHPNIPRTSRNLQNDLTSYCVHNSPHRKTSNHTNKFNTTDYGLRSCAQLREDCVETAGKISVQYIRTEKCKSKTVNYTPIFRAVEAASRRGPYFETSYNRSTQQII